MDCPSGTERGAIGLTVVSSRDCIVIFVVNLDFFRLLFLTRRQLICTNLYSVKLVTRVVVTMFWCRKIQLRICTVGTDWTLGK